MEIAKTAQKQWAKTPLWKRAELLHKAAALLKEHKAPIAECLVKEIAKPAKDAATEVLESFKKFDQCQNLKLIELSESWVFGEGCKVRRSCFVLC